MKILIVTDAWHPQVNGVVTTLSNVTKELIKAGHQVDIVEPSLFKSIPLIGYSEIKIAIETNQLKKYILNETYDYIHISLAIFAVKTNLSITSRISSSVIGVGVP